MDDVTLKATGLLSKGGFDGGDLLDDILDEAGYDTAARPVGDDDSLDPGFSGAVLGELVRRHIAPRIPLLEIDYDCSVAHNPVRLAGLDRVDLRKAEGFLSTLEVDLSPDEVLAVAAELAPRFEGAVRSPSPR